MKLKKRRNKSSKFIQGPVHTALFSLSSLFEASNLPVHIAPFLYKNGGKTSVLVHLRRCTCSQKRSENIRFVSSHFSSFVKLVLECRTVSTFDRIFENLHFRTCCEDWCESFYKNRCFPLRFLHKQGRC